jgi:hypothetical protein
MTETLTKADLVKISLGYNWTVEMSYEDFVKANKNLDPRDSIEIWDTINQRYITLKYEQ